MIEPWGTDYVELHCHSAYSLCDGTTTPAELVNRAADLGMDALALTDHNALYGALPFSTAAQQRGVHPIFGAELTLATNEHLTLLVADSQGWKNLCTLISLAQAAAPKGQAALPIEALAAYADGLICLTGCERGPVAGRLRRLDMAGALRAAQRLSSWFGMERTWIELQHHLHPGDTALVRDLIGLAQHLGLGYLLTNNVHYARRDGQPLHDLVTAVRHQTTLAECGTRLRGNSEYYLKTGARLRPLITAHPEALTNTRRVAHLCTYQLAYGLQDLPRFPIAQEAAMRSHSVGNADSYLAWLCHQAVPGRYPGSPTPVCRQLQHELRVIAQAQLSNYILIVADIVQFARRQGIRCQGRGSAANSLVAYLLDISPIDPLAHELVFERFLSDERPALPDIDLDIAADRREEVIQYVFQRYGTDHAAMACTFSTFRERSAVRDVAAALAMPLTNLLTTPDSGDRQQQLAQQLVSELYGLPRHLGQHNGGMVLTREPLIERIPTEPAAMPGRVVVQWDKEMLETAGLVKIDLLGLRMLAALTEAEQLIRHQADPDLDLNQLTFDDPAIYAMLAEADTIGVFQVESRAQAQVLPKLQPRSFADIIVAISLIRPGPLQGEMVHPYLRRRMGVEPVTYLHPLLEPALKETLGVILFQEQVLKIARDLAGFTAGQGEQLRRGLGSGKGADAMVPFRRAFLAGALHQGVPESIAAQIFQQLEAFGGYSFPKSHAAAFAIIVYQSAYLKRYHPAAFLVALLNQQPMGFWPPTILVRDARRHGVPIAALDIHLSNTRCTLDGAIVRLGLSSVIGLGESGAQRILTARNAKPFVNLNDLCRRTRLPRHLIEALIHAGACDGWGLLRRALLWELGTLRYETEELELPIPHAPIELPDLTPDEEYALQLQLLGVTIAEHPLARWRTALGARGYLSSSDLLQLQTGQRVRVLGTLILAQQPPTAKGHMFLTLEDEVGMINVVLRPGLATAARSHLQHSAITEVEGIVQRDAGTLTLLAIRVIRRARP